MTRFCTLMTPIGELALTGDGEKLDGVRFPNRARPAGLQRDNSAFVAARAELEAYFAGELRSFDLALDPRGTPFQLAVWEALRAIPYGETRSYGEIAVAIDRPDDARAVGSANGANPLPIIVPCHRVIGADGSLTGFGGGLPTKRALLDLEAGIAALPI